MSTTAMHDAGGKSRPGWSSESKVSARFSECDQYRYELSEVWDKAKSLASWNLINPSVACLEYAAPTLIKTGKFTRSWGYGGQLIGNVHAYRATDKTSYRKSMTLLSQRTTSPSCTRLVGLKKSYLAMASLPKRLRAEDGKWSGC